MQSVLGIQCDEANNASAIGYERINSVSNQKCCFLLGLAYGRELWGISEVINEQTVKAALELGLSCVFRSVL